SLTTWSDPWIEPQAQHADDQGKEPASTSICAWRVLRRRNIPDRPLEIPDISPTAAAIPARKDWICTRTVRSNSLQTPTREQSCRPFAGSNLAQSIAEHFRGEILLPLQIQF